MRGVDFAEEAHGEVQLLGREPAKTGDVRIKCREGFLLAAGEFQSDEEALRHGECRSLSRLRGECQEEDAGAGRSARAAAEPLLRAAAEPLERERSVPAMRRPRRGRSDRGGLVYVGWKVYLGSDTMRTSMFGKTPHMGRSSFIVYIAQYRVSCKARKQSKPTKPNINKIGGGIVLQILPSNLYKRYTLNNFV
jgi:hypothetical protein